jgi:hypothetical protein
MRLNPTVTEVARNFAEYINRVAFGGERFVLMRGKKAVAELRPVPSGRSLGELPALLRSLPSLGLEDASSLADDMSRFSADLDTYPLPDPWES